jgi:hypothetical protein
MQYFDLYFSQDPKEDYLRVREHGFPHSVYDAALG